MKKGIFKKFLLIAPCVVLVLMLYYINFGFNFIKELVFTFVYNTNVNSIERFAKEVEELKTVGYAGEEYVEFYTTMFKIYNKTFGEKDSIITFLLDEDGNIYHSNEHNEEFLSVFINDDKNYNEALNAVKNSISGEVTFTRDKVTETLFFHTISNGEKYYTQFFGIDKSTIELELNVYDVFIPICVIGLIMLIFIESTIWLKMTAAPN